MFNIRLANENDVFGMLEIYAPYVTHSSVTFECEVPRTYEMKRRVNTVINKYPWLICEKDGMIAGYAYAQEFSKREAYSWAAEVSVYIKEDYQRCNIASALYYALIELLKKQGFCTAFARITVPNEKSLAFHNAFGFIEAGHLHNAGYKLGDWHDVMKLEKSLIETYTSAPKDIIPITELDKNETEALFRMAEKIIRER